MNSNKAIIRNGRIVYGEEANTVQPSGSAAREKREEMKRKYRGELLQKNQVDYYKVNPEQAKELNPELRRLLS